MIPCSMWLDGITVWNWKSCAYRHLHFMRVTAEFFLDKNISMTVILRARKSVILAMMANAKDRDHLSSKFIYIYGLAVVRYIKKSIRWRSQEANMTIEYNRTKCMIDNEEKLVGGYSCSRRTSLWRPGLFISMVDIGALNGFINWMPKDNDWI